MTKLASIGILQSSIAGGGTTPYDVTLSVNTIQASVGFHASATRDIYTLNLSVPAPATGQSDSGTLVSISGAQAVDVAIDKDSGTASDAGTVDYRQNAGSVNTDSFNLGDPISFTYTFAAVNPGDLLEIVVQEG